MSTAVAWNAEHFFSSKQASRKRCRVWCKRAPAVRRNTNVELLKQAGEQASM